MMVVHPSGYYAWKANPISARQKEDQRLSGLIKQFWLESGGVYGYPKITGDLRAEGERCGKHRVYRLMKQDGLRSQTGIGVGPGRMASPPSLPRIKPGSRTSPTSAPMKAGFIWRSSLISSRAKLSAGQCSRAWIVT